jgi:glutathione S-transferase
MAEYTFFFHPQSRAQVVRWALHEVKANYRPVLVDWENKPPELLAANPMGKLPTIIHHAPAGDRVITETAAICHYLAEAERSNLRPRDNEKANYFRWLFFVSGPGETAVTLHNMGWDPDEQQQKTIGFGSYDLVVDALDNWLSTHEYVCGPRFTMADVYVGAQIIWGLMFKALPERDSFTAYAQRLSERPTFRRAETIDLTLVNENPKRAEELI